MTLNSCTPTYGQCFASLALGMAPLFLLLAISALFGGNTVTSGGQNVHGVGAIVVCGVLNVLFPAIFAGVQKRGYMFLDHIGRRRSGALS